MEIVLHNPLLLIGLAALFLYVSVRYPLRAAQLIVFLLPTYVIRIRVIEAFPTNILELFVIIFTAVLLLKLGRGEVQKRIPPKQFLIGMAMFITGAIMATGAVLLQESSLTSEISKTALGALKGFILIPVLFVMTISVTKNIWEGRDGILKAYIASTVAVAFIALASTVFLETAITFDGRLRGFYLSPNHLAMYLMPAAVLLWGLRERSKKKIFAFLLLMTVLMWTQSAGVVVGLLLAVGLFLMPRVFKKIHAEKMLQTLPAMLLIGGLLFAVTAGSFADQAWSEGARSSFASRTMIWRTASEIIGEHWVLGIGPGLFQDHYLALQETFPPYLEWAVPTPHNAAMALWLSTGLLGILGVLVMVWPSKRRAWSPIHTAASVALAAILFHGFVDTPLLKNDLTVMFLLLISLRLQSTVRAETIDVAV